MHIRHILFDLDGTLLPMNQDEFVTFYMPLLAKKYISEGISFDPKAFIASVWKGYGAMVNNDGSYQPGSILAVYGRTASDGFGEFRTDCP